MISIIDYDTGNLQSVRNALSRLNAEFTVTADHDTILRSSHVILPGVGEASSAMQKLRDRGLDSLIPRLSMPVLGICIGMQLMCIHSQEGDADCMGIFRSMVRKLDADGLKIPHVGWDNVAFSTSALFHGIDSGSFFYYVHSYAADISPDTIASTIYGKPFAAALRNHNFFGVQFHPEKSGSAGEVLLSNFLSSTL